LLLQAASEAKEYLRNIPEICFQSIGVEYSRYIPVIYVETYTWNIPEIFQNGRKRISQTYT
jgi:hypothetical protein